MHFAASTVELECESTAPGHARRHLAETLDQSGAGSAYPDAALVLSELVTNALMHTDCVHLRVDVAVHVDGRLRLAVIDPNSSQLTARRPAEDTVGGRGLMIVDAITSDWGVEITSGGKAVWAEMCATEGDQR